jgi:tetratricopeptide (TPR) repeat protein
MLWRQALDHFNNREYQEAYSVLYELEPRAKVFYNIAMCALLIGNPEKALEMLERCVQCDPYFSIASFQLGCLKHHRQKDDLGAIEAFREAIRVRYFSRVFLVKTNT